MKIWGLGVVYCAGAVLFSIQDIRRGEVPRLGLWVGIAVAVAGRFWLLGAEAGREGLAGCGLGMAVFIAVYACLKGKLGLADVWYAGFAGAVFGPVWWLPVSVGGCVFALGYMLVFRRRSVAFIPFMAAGGMVALPFFLKFAGESPL
jgi:prepilin signal peptidase PulO-like enzyme (type II secretory pathway)